MHQKKKRESKYLINRKKSKPHSKVVSVSVSTYLEDAKQHYIVM